MAQAATAARRGPGVAGRGQSVSDRIGHAAVREGIDLSPASNGFTPSANNLIPKPEIQTAQRQAVGQTACGLRLGILSLRIFQSERSLKPRRARRAQRGLRPQPKRVFSLWGLPAGLHVRPLTKHACSEQSTGSLTKSAGSLLCTKRNLSIRNLRKKTKFSQVVVRIRGDSLRDVSAAAA